MEASAASGAMEASASSGAMEASTASGAMEASAASSAIAEGDLGDTFLDGAAEGRLRWAVNSQEWKPAGEFDGSEFQYLLSLIRETSEREAVSKFVRFADQKRAVLSRLLVRRACAAVLGFNNFKEIEIARTKGKKPFLRKPRPREDRPDLCNFNFNVSHEGEWVVLASEPMCLCGVDVAAPHDRRPGGKEFDVFATFKEQLTEEEWRTVEHEAACAVAKRMQAENPKDSRRLLDVEEVKASSMFFRGWSMEDNASSNRSTVRPLNQPVGYQAFQRFWSAKEAFVKARGDGLGFELNRAEFTFTTVDETIPTYTATLTIDGKSAPFWRCFQERLGENHWATVARGPTGDIVDAHGEFTKTFNRQTASIPFFAWEEELMKESPRFLVVPVGFLVPSDDMAGYISAGGRGWPPDTIPPAIADNPEATQEVQEEEAAAADTSTADASKDETEKASVNEAAEKAAADAAADAAKAKALKEIAKLEEKAKAHTQNKEYPESMACYTLAIEHAQAVVGGAPTELYTLFCKRAACQLEVEEYNGALLDADKAVELNQVKAEAYAYQARAFEGLGGYERAVECLQKARERKKGDDTAVEKLIADVVARNTELQ